MFRVNTEPVHSEQCPGRGHVIGGPKSSHLHPRPIRAKVISSVNVAGRRLKADRESTHRHLRPIRALITSNCDLIGR